MPQYFFTIHGRAKVDDDRAGTDLPDVAAALSYAEYTIRELRKKSGYTYNNDCDFDVAKRPDRCSAVCLSWRPMRSPSP